MILKINYGVNRRVEGKSKKHIEYKNGKLVIQGDWESNETHKAIRDGIQQSNPGWNVTGYACTNKTIKRLYREN